MRALSMRQPWAELILRGIKKIEYRNRRASGRVIGKRFCIYAALKFPPARPHLPVGHVQGKPG